MSGKNSQRASSEAFVWICGSIVVFGRWTLRWSRMCRAMRRILPIQEGREVDALRRMERLEGHYLKASGIRVKPLPQFLCRA
jgi:hypothetical protein